MYFQPKASVHVSKNFLFQLANLKISAQKQFLLLSPEYHIKYRVLPLISIHILIGILYDVHVNKVFLKLHLFCMFSSQG